MLVPMEGQVMPEWLPIHQAAPRLRLSLTTLKRHIKSGKVNARKEAAEKGWRWLIEVPDEPPSAQLLSSDTHTERERLIAHLESQLDWYKEELANRRREVAELHRLLHDSQQVHQLSPPPPDLSPVISMDHKVVYHLDHQPEASKHPTDPPLVEQVPDRHDRRSRWRFWPRRSSQG